MDNLLHICSLNCQGLGQRDKRERLYQWIKNQKCDILYAQETHLIKHSQCLLNDQFHGESFHSYGTSNSRGYQFLSKED